MSSGSRSVSLATWLAAQDQESPYLNRLIEKDKEVMNEEEGVVAIPLISCQFDT